MGPCLWAKTKLGTWGHGPGPSAQVCPAHAQVVQRSTFKTICRGSRLPPHSTTVPEDEKPPHASVCRSNTPARGSSPRTHHPLHRLVRRASASAAAAARHHHGARGPYALPPPLPSSFLLSLLPLPNDAQRFLTIL